MNDRITAQYQYARNVNLCNRVYIFDKFTDDLALFDKAETYSDKFQIYHNAMKYFYYEMGEKCLPFCDERSLVKMRDNLQFLTGKLLFSDFMSEVCDE